MRGSADATPPNGAPRGLWYAGLKSSRPSWHVWDRSRSSGVGGSAGSALAFVLTGPSEGSPCPSTASATAVAAILASPCHRRAKASPGGGVRTLPRPEGPSAPCRPSLFGLKGWAATALSGDRRPRSRLDARDRKSVV